jgi:hypothetical protein
MTDDFDKEREKKKKAIFDGMGPRHQQRILKKIGYENWDPFQAPKDPLDLRDRKSDLIASALIRKFISDCEIEDPDANYIRALMEISKGLLKGEEKYKAIYDFCCWYQKAKKDPDS